MTSSTPNWPTEGEIDKTDQANNADSNQMSLHVPKQQGKCNIATSVSMKAKQDRWNDCTKESVTPTTLSNILSALFSTATTAAFMQWNGPTTTSRSFSSRETLSHLVTRNHLETIPIIAHGELQLLISAEAVICKHTLRSGVLPLTLISAVTGMAMTGAAVIVLLVLVRALARLMSRRTLALSRMLSGLSRACRFSSRWMMGVWG